MPNSFTPQQIEEFLQEFFDVAGTRQYTGARYVPIFGRAGSDTVEWDDTEPYEALTVVMHEGVSYVSRRYVPRGIQVTDTAYWAETYRFNAQVEAYRQEVLGFDARITANAEAIVAGDTEVMRRVADEYVPFPDEATLPKYGQEGQLLSTLGDGATEWVDPVIVTSEIAGPLIEDWLDDHPEATTTVLDGSITTAKLAAGAVTDEKLAQTGGILEAFDDSQREAVVRFDTLDPEAGYMTAAGTIQSSNDHYHVSVPIRGAYRFRYVMAHDAVQSLVVAVAKGPSGTVVASYDARLAGTYDFAIPKQAIGGTLYLNWYTRVSTPYEYCDRATIWANANVLDELLLDGIAGYSDQIAAISTDAFAQVLDYRRLTPYAGRCLMNTSGELATASGHCVVRVPSDGIRHLEFAPLSAPAQTVPFAVVKDSGGNVVSYANSSGASPVSLDLNVTGGTVYLNWFEANGGRSILNEATATYSVPVLAKPSALWLPFDFKGRTVFGFGDSILAGYVSGTETTTENFGKVFCDAMGATLVNHAIPSSAFASGYNGVQTIVDKIQNTDLTGCEFLLIAGGVNDCQLGVSESDFNSALQTLCNWLRGRYYGPVAFVLPINFSKSFSAQVNPLETYRNYLRLKARSNGYLCIETTNYGFPTGSTPTETTLATQLYGDGLHPTVLGHKLYGLSLAADPRMRLDLRP